MLILGLFLSAVNSDGLGPILLMTLNKAMKRIEDFSKLLTCFVTFFFLQKILNTIKIKKKESFQALKIILSIRIKVKYDNKNIYVQYFYVLL